MKENAKCPSFFLPGWVLVVFTVLYHELMLHLWITGRIQPGRLAAVCLFGLGCGGVVALVTTFLSPNAAKWTAVALSGLVCLVWMTEYFISDAYQVFMDPKTILSGAGGVAQDYLDLVLSLLWRNLWRIGLMLLPVVLYAIFCRSGKSGWQQRTLVAGLALAGYLLGAGAVYGLTNDASRFATAYNFDSAVRCFGLNMALTLETVKGGAAAQQQAFLQPETAPTPPPEESTQPTVAYEDNIMAQLDFAAMGEAERSPAVANLHRYVASLPPSRQNAYTGLFAGKNMILITAEAFAAEVIDPLRTPTLYRLANEGIRFTDYYQPAWGASTTSGEFSNLVGLVPTNYGLCMKEARQQDLFLTIGNRLQEQGYHSVAYHNHNADFYDRDKTHVHLGYDTFQAQYGGLEGITPVWPESDLEMIDVTVPQYIHKQPFSVYYMTVSGHCLYSVTGNTQSKKHYDKVADLDAAEAVKCYHASQLELEYALESLVGQLEEAGIADDTVIVLATDHYPYGLERSGTWQNTADYLKELYGVESYDQFVRDHNALIIWSGSIEGQNIQVEDPVYSLDILPTLCNLFGVEYDSRLLVGRDVFSDAPALVLWPDHSWITRKGRYDAKTGTFTAKDGEIPEDYVEQTCAQVANKITYCASVLETDYFNYLAKEIGRE